MEEHYKKLYEITERENQSLTKIVETQKHMIANLTQENETLKSACAGLNAQLEKVVALYDEQQQLLDEIIRSEEKTSRSKRMSSLYEYYTYLQYNRSSGIASLDYCDWDFECFSIILSFHYSLSLI